MLVLLSNIHLAVAESPLLPQPQITLAYHLNGLSLKKDPRQGVRLHLRRSTPSSFDLDAPESWRNKKFRLWLVPWHSTGANAYKVLTFYHNKPVSVSAKTPFVRANLSYDFLLPSQAFDVVRLVFFPAPGAERPEVVIDRLEITGTVWEDLLIVPYLVALVLLLLLIVPGLGLVAALCRNLQPGLRGVLLLFPAAMVFWILVYFIFFLLRSVFPSQVGILFPGLVFVSLLVLIVPAWRSLVGEAELRKVVLFFVVSGLLLTHVMIKDTPLPEQNFNYNSVSGPKTFWAFWALDNYFPYVNSRALARNESFAKYYGPPGHPALFYQPEDREMASGAMYAAIRTILKPVSSLLADSYITFASFALFCNLMVVFPMWLLMKRYLPDRNPLPVLLATAATAFFVGNLFMAWFKMAGAALFLCGLAWWLIDKGKYRWWLAGTIFGLATNMHASLAMGLPVLFIWFVSRDLPWRKSSLSEWGHRLFGPLQFILVFTLINMPWAIIKLLYFKPSTVLLQQMFLNGEDHPNGLWATMRLFFEHNPLAGQLHYRLQQMADSLQLVNWSGIFSHLSSNYFEGLRLWNLFEFDHLSMLFAPLLVFLLLQELWFRLYPSSMPIALSYTREQKQLLSVCMISTLLLLFLGYGAPPDINYHNPMAILVLAYMLLVIRLLYRKGPSRVVYFAYLGFTVYRLSTQL